MTDISELFARDPLKLTRDDITDIIKRMRDARAQFNLGNVKAGSTKPLSEKAKATKSLADSLDLKLDL